MRVIKAQRYFAAAVFCLLAGLIVILVGTSTALRYRAPDMALAAWPWNGEARGALAGHKVLNGDFAGARSIAARAVREAPGAAISLRALGMAQPPAETAHLALRLMQLATRASRRDLQTNLWFIEYNVARGDIPGVIRYYDYSLKSSADSERLLFPVLVSAMTSPDIAAAVRSKLLARPVWTTSFLQYAFASGAADDQLIGITLSLAHDRAGLPIDLKRQYAQRLAERGNYDGLDRLARGLGHPLIGGTATLDASGDLPPADWRLMSEQGVSTFADPASGFSFVANQNSALAERILHLPPGTYALDLATKFESGGSDARLPWSMTCFPDGRPVAIVAADNRSRLVVPPGRCTYQKLSLSIDSDRFVDGAEITGNVSKMRIERLR